MDLQEAIIRGRFLFKGAPQRLEVFKFINGTNNTKTIAKKCKRTLSSILNDIKKMEDLGLIIPKVDLHNNIKKINKSTVYSKVALFNSIPMKLFIDQEKGQKKITNKKIKKNNNSRTFGILKIPNETEILDICKDGEDQQYEFKQAGTETEKITKEIAAMLNTKRGGIIFYGVDDTGSILGTDKSRQSFDQSIQNSMRHNIAPPPIVKIIEKNVMGQKILLIIVPPWNKKNVYHYKEKVLLRKGTNVFGVTPEESKKLHNSIFII